MVRLTEQSLCPSILTPPTLRPKLIKGCYTSTCQNLQRWPRNSRRSRLKKPKRYALYFRVNSRPIARETRFAPWVGPSCRFRRRYRVAVIREKNLARPLVLRLEALNFPHGGGGHSPSRLSKIKKQLSYLGGQHEIPSTSRSRRH